MSDRTKVRCLFSTNLSKLETHFDGPEWTKNLTSTYYTVLCNNYILLHCTFATAGGEG